MDKSYIDGLLGAAIYTRILKDAFIKGNLNEPIATPYTLVYWLSAETPFIGTYRATHNSSFQTLQNWYTEFSQISHLQAIAPVDLLYNPATKWCRANVK